MATLNLQDLRFLLSRVRGETLPEELGGLAPLGPTGIRDVQGVGNNTLNELSPNWWFGAADTLFPRETFNRLLAPTKKNDVISAPFANSERGPSVTVTIGDTATIGGKFMDALNPRNISNLISDSSAPVGFQSLNPADPNYAAKHLLQLQDNPTGRISPVSGAVNPLVYSNWTSQFGQFFDHGLDFVSKGVDGKVKVELLPSDGLFVANRATTITGSRSNTVNVTIGEGSTDALLTKLGILDQQGQPSWAISSTLTDPAVRVNGGFAYEGTLVINNTLIKIAAVDQVDLAAQINLYTPTTGVTAIVEPFPAIPGTSVPAGSFRFDLVPTDGESFNQTSPFIDLSQTYGSDASRTLFLREYLDEATWRTALVNQGLEATVTDLTTGRLVSAGVTVNGEAKSGIANWAQIKANALNVGITLHDADITGIPLVAFDDNGQMILDANGMPQLVALNKVTGEVVYVKDTTLANDAAIQLLIADPNTDWAATDFVLQTTKHAFLNDMGVRLPALTDTAVWNDRDLIDTLQPASQFGPAVNYKQALEADYIAGDGRLNENIGLTAVQEVFVNEHNRTFSDLMTQYGFTGPQPVGGWTWTDPLTNVTTQITGEELFQQAKLFNEMTYQHLVFDQFVRKISPNIAGFAGVDPLIDARISSEFANAVYRFGHSMLPEKIGLRQVTDAAKLSTTTGSQDITVTIANHGFKTGDEIKISNVDQAIGGISANAINSATGVNAAPTVITVIDQNTFKFAAGAAATSTVAGLATDKIQIDIDRGLIDAFLNPQSYTPGQTANLLAEGSTSEVGMRIDEKVTDALRDNLLGQPLDLAALNLIRGRDAGLPTLNEMRGAIQAVAPALLVPTLAVYTSWTNFRDNLKGTAVEQAATVKNFIMAYASDDILTKFATTKTLTEWYGLRESANTVDQQAYMTALKAATETAYANATWMGTRGNQDFNRVDAWIGGLAEREVAGGMLGSTFDAIFAMQMMKLQNGDNFYYLGRVPATEFFVENMEGVQLSDIVMRATGAQNLYGDIFSVADKYVYMDGVGPAPVANLAALQASTTNQQVFNTAGEVVMASIGRAGYVTGNTFGVQGNTFYGNAANYVDARGVLNPNGIGNASEMIAGTAGNDIIDALGGNDTVRAGNGNDRVNGGSGVDFLYGGDGNDILNGGAENDFMYGNAGVDTMRGEIGGDIMFGGDGNDTMYGGLDADVMIGGNGNDIMYGGDGVTVAGVLDPEPAVATALLDDIMNGGAGDDTLYGGGGWDDLHGDSGHDIIDPGAGGIALGGRDSMDGGHGDDIYIIESALDFANQDIGDTGLTQAQLVNKGAGFRQGNGLGIDEVRFTQSVAADIVLAGTNVLGVVQDFTGVERVVIGTGTGAVADRTGVAAINIDASLAVPGVNVGLEILGNAGANIIVGTAFDDIIDGGLGIDTMEGGIGNDTYLLSEVGDIVVEGVVGGGTDTVIVNGAFNYTLGVDFENLTLRSTALQGTGNDLDNVIIGNASANVLSGLGGNDTIDGGAGNDRIDGGAGVDRLIGGAGNDTFVFQSVSDIGNDPLFRETIVGFVAGDRLDFTAIDANTNLAGFQAFTVPANATSFSGNAGELIFVNGVLSGDVNGDRVADFQLFLEASPAPAIGPRAAPSVLSLSMADLVQPPVVTIAGPASIIEGNTGTNNQVFTVSLDRALDTNLTLNYTVAGSGANPASNADFQGAGTGTVTFNAGSTTATITVGITVDTVVEANETFSVTLTPPANATTNVNVSAATITSTIVNDDGVAPVTNTINGTAGGDTLNGTAGADTINGLAGVDTLNGLAGNDVLNGGDGDDTLNGGDGNDILVGGIGRDTMTGGAGADTFRFIGPGFAEVGTRDRILDFSSTQGDLIDLSSVDANAGLAGVQAFTFIGAGAFTGVGQLRYANGVLQGNVDTNLGADFSVTMRNVASMSSADFVGLAAPVGTQPAGTLPVGTQPLAIVPDPVPVATISGTAGVNILNGTAQADVINGLAGNDLLIGNGGFDTLIGGAGSDTFRFNANVAEIGNTLGSTDVIWDFLTASDRIDLSRIDANTGAGGNQAFTFVGGAAFSGAAGELRYVVDPATGVGQLQGNVNADTVPDFIIGLRNNAVVTQRDVIL
jgi:Ca2+-binding RTX toxin-like protein